MPGVAALQPAFDRILGQHHVDRKVLADVAQEIEIAEAAHPVVVVHQQGRRSARVEIEQRPHLRFDAGDVGAQRVDREQVALLALAAGVADHAGGAADQRDRADARRAESAAASSAASRCPTCRLSAVGSKPA